MRNLKRIKKIFLFLILNAFFSGLVYAMESTVFESEDSADGSYVELPYNEEEQVTEKGKILKVLNNYDDFKNYFEKDEESNFIELIDNYVKKKKLELIVMFVY